MTDSQLLALVGPTASGKTAAAMHIAPRLDAEVVSVDSMLVYRGMDVGTAKPTPEQRALVTHHVIDVVDPSEPFSVATYQGLARDAVERIRSRGRRALLVGGTGLYFRAVVDALEFPGTASGTRALLEAEAAVLGPHRMHRRLVAFDPVAAGRIGPANARRTVRALEVAAITGRTFSSFARAWDRFPEGRVRAAGVAIARPALHRRIDARTRQMMPGLLAETRALMDRGFATYLTSTQAIGYAEAVAVLEGSVGQEEAVDRVAGRTKSLARRQMGWFRRDPRIRWFEAGDDGAADVVDQVVRYFSRDAAEAEAASVASMEA